MKSLSRLAAQEYFHPETRNVLVHAIQNLSRLEFLSVPMMSSEIRCPMCNGSEGYAPLVDAGYMERMWFCAKLQCLIAVKNKRKSG